MKKRKGYWFRQSRAKQRAMFLNVKGKIENYRDILPLTAVKVDRIILICNIFLTVFDFTEQIRATSKSVTDWQNLIFEGDEGKIGDPAPVPPVFQTISLPPDSFIGIFEEFKGLVDDIKHADNYTDAIGEDLMIVGEDSEDLNLNDLTAELKNIQSQAGYKIRLESSLQQMSAMRVEYWAKGASIPQIDTFTKFPALMTIYPKTPGDPESGHLRCYLLKDNEKVGLVSPDYPVTLSP